jgi:hypothetical protein
MEENQSNQTPEEEEKGDTPLQSIGIGLLIIAVSVFVFYTFDNMEKEGGSVRINWIFALIYKLGGKWPGPIIFAIIGALISFGGVKDLIKKK